MSDQARRTEPDEVERNRMPLIEHLRELRHRLIVSAAAVAVGMIVSLLFVDVLYAVLTAPIRAVLEDVGGGHPVADHVYLTVTAGIRGLIGEEKVPGMLAITTSPLEGVSMWLRVAFVGGLSLASPVVAFQVWQFVAPGLYQSERRMVVPLALASSGLFLIGVAFAYFVVLPFSFPFFLTVLDAAPVLSVAGYLDTVGRTLVVFGVCFQLPIATWFAARLGLIDHRDMVGGFRYAIIAIFVIAAILTPPDVLSQTVLAVPLIGLYGASIVVAFFATTKKR